MLESTNAYSGFAVPDIAAAKQFYGETLGVKTEVVSEEMGLLALHHPDGRQTLIYVKPDHTPATYTILNFVVDDVDGTVDELSSRGVTFEQYDGMDQDEKGIAQGPGPRIAWFTDPAGNILAVHSAPN